MAADARDSALAVRAQRVDLTGVAAMRASGSSRVIASNRRFSRLCSSILRPLTLLSAFKRALKPIVSITGEEGDPGASCHPV
jgi:hypothetical protein